MMTVGTVKIYFLTADEGGQSIIPVGNFSTPIIIEEDRKLINGLWSAVIEFHKSPNTHAGMDRQLSFANGQFSVVKAVGLPLYMEHLFSKIIVYSQLLGGC
ncbi:hypothetical protein ACFQZR_12600 [Paenibacillus sp. GCM10027629]|uniref:hypothetical protein n=1 Tax=Paenibacillus sp. GCM10027629 TaxID=3273414 RepID=UPI0036409AAE